MNLRRLTLHGFKSFPDRTQLHFHAGVTAIVGPNGSGKSNISDAVRWVLGEQRASAIRSSKMEEAIFQGSTVRRRVNRAEVALVFSNEDRLLPLPYDEVEIRRTVFREGGSEYQLNRSAVRLRDILDVFRDTGLGANAYAIIEQRMVDAILSDRAEERRHLFEEAAGIGRYKDRRKAAERRLESARADLARLDDLLGEVQSKVRSLARQRGRAQRHLELRDRRLSLDVALAGSEMEGIESELDELATRLRELGTEGPGRAAELAAVEVDLERRRLEVGELTRERAGVAERVEVVRRRLSESERELAVGAERRSGAEARLARIAEERKALRSRGESLEASLERLQADSHEAGAALENVRKALADAARTQQVMRASAVEARQEEDAVRTRDEEASRRIAQLTAEVVSAEASAREMEERLGRTAQERHALEAELAALDQQGDLFEERGRELSGVVERLTLSVDGARAALAGIREREREHRERAIRAEDAVHRIASRVAVLEVEEREFQGFAAPVAAALAAREKLAGIEGALAQLIDFEPERAAAIEATVGGLLQAIVIRDVESVESVRRWAGREGAVPGVLAMLTHDSAATARRLLEELAFAGRAAAGPLLLGRAERLEGLRAELASARREREAAEAAREEAATAAAGAEHELRTLEERHRDSEADLRRTRSEEEARVGRRGATERLLAELDQRAEKLRAAVDEARAIEQRGRLEMAALEGELDGVESLREAAAERRARADVAWEEAREREGTLRVEEARLEAAATAAEHRMAEAAAALQERTGRLATLDEEEARERTVLEATAQALQQGEEETQALFGERDTLLDELHAMDRRLSEASEAADDLERRVRTLRRDAGTLTEERHALELRRTELQGARRSVLDRLTAEWGRPFEVLRREAGPLEDRDPEAVRAELRAVAADLERLGPINMLAVEEHEEESRRLDFLQAQKTDLVAARDDLQTAIRRINRAARERFEETFHQVQENFTRTFRTLFEGGECGLWLADPEDPLESPIEISASPRGKRTQRINLLSGGERALTSLALLFAIYLVKPSPFCVLDEVDAPLDEANIGRFVAMLEQFKEETQFIVITHNPRTMEAADYIYGVTMEEPGVSRIVGVQLEEPAVSPAPVEA